MKLAERWDAFWNGPKSVTEPSPSSTPEPMTAHDGSNVVYLSASEPTLKPTLAAISLVSRQPRELAKQHALMLLQHLINIMDDVPAEHRILTTGQIQGRYVDLCDATNTAPRNWNSVATCFNRLTRQDGKPLKPYLDLVDPKTKELRKYRVYSIPATMPADWQERLDPARSKKKSDSVQPTGVPRPSP